MASPGPTIPIKARPLPPLTPASAPRGRPILSAPHRIMFAAGVAQGLLAFLWWLLDLTGRYGGAYAAPAWTVPPAWAHLHLALYGFFPFFIFGFLMTAMPSWVNLPVRPRDYRPSALLMAAGLLVYYAGLAFGRPLAVLGGALHLAGYVIAWLGLLRLVKDSGPSDKRFPVILVGAGALGGLGALASVLALAGGSARLADLAWRLGLWLYLTPTFFAVCLRMIPFFSSRVLDDYVQVRPAWALPLFLGGAALHGGLEFAGAFDWLWLADAPMAGGALWLSARWGLRRSGAVRLLTVLHLAFAGFALALLLYTAQSLALFVFGAHILGLGPLHALTLGYFCAMVVAMVSRVSLGHSGRDLWADDLTWRCFLGVLATALLRVLADAPFLPIQAGMQLTVLAALVWVATLAPWAWRYLPIYFSPRADGKPG